MAEPITVTPELLQLAWIDRRRPHWPDTFEACMADDMLRRVVRAEAIRLALALRGRARRAELLQAPPPMRPLQAPARLRAPALRDLKRAAAGDASDD